MPNDDYSLRLEGNQDQCVIFRHFYMNCLVHDLSCMKMLPVSPISGADVFTAENQRTVFSRFHRYLLISDLWYTINTPVQLGRTSSYGKEETAGLC